MGETVHVLFLKRIVNWFQFDGAVKALKSARVLRIEEDDGWSFCWEIEIGLCVGGRDAMKATEKCGSQENDGLFLPRNWLLKVLGEDEDRDFKFVIEGIAESQAMVSQLFVVITWEPCVSHA